MKMPILNQWISSISVTWTMKCTPIGWVGGRNLRFHMTCSQIHVRKRRFYEHYRNCKSRFSHMKNLYSTYHEKPIVPRPNYMLWIEQRAIEGEFWVNHTCGSPLLIIIYFRVFNCALFSTYYFSTLFYIDIVLTLSLIWWLAARRAYRYDRCICCLTTVNVSLQLDNGALLTCESDGKVYLDGLATRGQECRGRGLPSIFTRTSPYFNWIVAATVESKGITLFTGWQDDPSQKLLEGDPQN